MRTRTQNIRAPGGAIIGARHKAHPRQLAACVRGHSRSKGEGHNGPGVPGHTRSFDPAKCALAPVARASLSRPARGFGSGEQLPQLELAVCRSAREHQAAWRAARGGGGGCSSKKRQSLDLAVTLIQRRLIPVNLFA